MRRCTMSKKKDPKLYELILDWTQSGNLLWKRLDDEETNDPFVKRATDDMNIDLIESFYTNISSGTIYVISDFGGDPALFVQPNGGAALTEFDVSTPQINQLKNAIKDQVDDVTEFIVPFPVSWTVKMKKKQKETQDILSYHTQAAGCSDKARAKASGGRQPIEECGRTGL